VHVAEISASDLYDIAVALERVRLRDAQRMLVLGAEKIGIPSRPAHHLWADCKYAQPIGYLECYLLQG
jgi:hypothetical protein